MTGCLSSSVWTWLMDLVLCHHIFHHIGILFWIHFDFLGSLIQAYNTEVISLTIKYGLHQQQKRKGLTNFSLF